MSTFIEVNPFSKTPKYVQINESIINSIKSGKLAKGSRLPSINKICGDNHLARETVVKAFNKLKEKGIITSVHGKGFFISSTNTNTINRVFVLFDTFTSYKETLFHSIKEAFGENTILDIYFHHFNYEVFKNTIATHIGNYMHYIILPINHKKIANALVPVPEEKLYLLDIKPNYLQSEFVGVYQDFQQDVIESLASIKNQIQKYQSITLIFRNTITDPPKELEDGFIKYCVEQKVNYNVSYEKIKGDIEAGNGYIAIDDTDLVKLVEVAQTKGYEIGKDIGIISYNDTPLKKVVGNGISVISTDFTLMGKQIAAMINSNDRTAIRNKTTFVDRGSF